MQVYTTIESLQEIFFNQSDQKIQKIIEDHSDVILDLTTEDFESLFDDPLIKLLYKRPALNCLDHKTFFDTFEEEDLSKFTSDLFILNQDPDYCLAKSKEFGVLVVSKDNLTPLNTLFGRPQWLLKKGSSYKEAISGIECIGWETWIDKIPECPLNSIIIIDNYLIENEYSCLNICRLISLLISWSKLPKFHITIIHQDLKMILTVAKLEALKEEIVQYFINKEGIEIELTLLTHGSSDKFHERYIITNYHLISTGKGFNKFRDDKVTDKNFLKFSGAFDTIGEKGNSTLEFMFDETISARQQVNDNLSYKNIIPTNLLVGTGKNRLFDNL